MLAALEKKKSLTEIRMRLNKQMKTKTSQFLPPQKKSMLQVSKCIHYEVNDSSRADEAIISVLLLQGNGWTVNSKKEEVDPLGFTGTLLTLA